MCYFYLGYINTLCSWSRAPELQGYSHTEPQGEHIPSYIWVYPEQHHKPCFQYQLSKIGCQKKKKRGGKNFRSEDHLHTICKVLIKHIIVFWQDKIFQNDICKPPASSYSHSLHHQQEILYIFFSLR